MMASEERNDIISDFKSEIKVEEKSTENEIHCDQCGKVFSTEKDLEHHNKSLHQKIEDLACKVCKKAFSKYRNLKIHKRVHEERKFPCEICGLKVQTKKSLVNHMESRHMGISKKQYFCQDCGIHYSHSAHKLKHIDQSEREKFTCDICGNQFLFNKNLKAHERRHLAEKYKVEEKEEVIYSNKFKLEALEKSKEIGFDKMAKLLGMNESTIKGWGRDDFEGHKVVHHPLKVKQEVVAFALASSCTEAGRKYKMEEATIRFWIKKLKHTGAIEEEGITPKGDYVQKKYSAQVYLFFHKFSKFSSLSLIVSS